MCCTLTSTDTTDPMTSAAQAIVVAGADDDSLSVTFDDDMIQAEVENLANWSFESPIGTAWTFGGETVSYNAGTRQVVLRLDAGGQFLRVNDTFRMSFITMRDIAGNTIGSGNIDGTVEGEVEVGLDGDDLVHAVLETAAEGDPAVRRAAAGLVLRLRRRVPRRCD